ncbi:hypothetical protein ACODM8_05090 [Vibrio ostreicida]|uniref:hypothetical protein n=1 Tax=Vibrio ostreicida TaxID=526588 RepID=UPI000970E9FA|nr:hypothetical protein [Vibrio ostreicida]
MSVSSVQSGYQVIEQSTRLAEDAAREINQLEDREPVQESPAPTQENIAPIQKDDTYEFNKVEFKEPDSSLVEPLVKLTQAEQYSRVGTNMLQRDQEMIGTLLDVHV